MADYALEDVLERAFKSMLGDIEIGLPAKVDAYDSSAQTVRAVPSVGPSIAIPDVPVLFPSGGGYGMTWPLEKGDDIWLVFSGRSYRAWLAGAENEDAKHRFSIGDCAALPQSPRQAMDADASAMLLGEKGGAQIRIEDGRIELGTTAVGLLALLDSLLSLLQSAVVATALGPQPLDPATQAQLVIIQNQLAQIKG